MYRTNEYETEELCKVKLSNFVKWQSIQIFHLCVPATGKEAVVDGGIFSNKCLNTLPLYL